MQCDSQLPAMRQALLKVSIAHEYEPEQVAAHMPWLQLFSCSCGHADLPLQSATQEVSPPIPGWGGHVRYALRHAQPLGRRIWRRPQDCEPLQRISQMAPAGAPEQSNWRLLHAIVLHKTMWRARVVGATVLPEHSPMEQLYQFVVSGVVCNPRGAGAAASPGPLPSVAEGNAAATPSAAVATSARPMARETVRTMPAGRS